jgi:hypothetical protein
MLLKRFPNRRVMSIIDGTIFLDHHGWALSSPLPLFPVRIEEFILDEFLE